MAQLAFLLGLLIARCPIPCIAPGDELDLELRLSSSLTDPDPSLKQHAAIIHPNAGVSVSGGPDLVMTTPSWLAFQSRVANPPSTDARISTSGSVDDSIAPITLKSPTEAGPQRQEPRNMGAGILLKELPQWTGANTPLPSFIQRSSSIQQVAPLEKSLDHTGTRRKGILRDGIYNEAASSKRPMLTSLTIPTTNPLSKNGSFYRPIATSVEELEKIRVQRLHMPSGSIGSKPPFKTMMNSKPPIRLIFDADVFAYKEADRELVEEGKIQYLISQIDMQSRTKSLLIDESDPEKAQRILEKISLHRSVNDKCGQDYSPVKKNLEYSNSRRRLQKGSVKKMWQGGGLWLNYLKEKGDIHHDYEKLQAVEGFSLPEVQEHFLLFMIYVNMITSIVVNKKEPNWEEKLLNNSDVLKNAARMFQGILEEVAKNNLQHEGRALLTWKAVRKNKLRITWLSMRKWLEHEGKYPNLYKLIINHKVPSIDLFDDVFVNSIVNLHERMYQHFHT